MHKDDSKIKNLKALYEQRRERIVSRISEINLTEYTIRRYLNLKNDYGVGVGVGLFFLFLILSASILKSAEASILLSSSVGFGFASIYNFVKYKKMKKIVEENPNIDFYNYDFDLNKSELDSLFKELFDIDNYFLNQMDNYRISKKEDVKFYQNYSFVRFNSYEDYSCDAVDFNNSKVKKIGSGRK